MNHNAFRNDTNVNMMGVPVKPTTDEELLNSLESVISFSSLTPAAVMILRDLQQRAARAFARKDELSPDLLGDGHLYTTIRRTDRNDHFIIETDEDKSKVDQILENHRHRDTEKWTNDEERRQSLFGELVKLGEILKMISTDPYGNQLGRETAKVSFSQLVLPNFPMYRLGPPPKGLPRLVITYPIGICNPPFNSEVAKVLETEVLEAVRLSPKLSSEDVVLIKNYLSHNAVFQVYLEDLEKRLMKASVGMIGQRYTSADPMSRIQVHVFPRGNEELIICTDNLPDNNEGFVSREQYPELFHNQATAYSSHTLLHTRGVWG